jgi:transposase
MVVLVGDDWAEAHHDLYVMDEAGERLDSARVPHGLDGMARFHELVAGHVDDASQVVVGIEVDRGLWVEALLACGYQVYGINPRAAASYRNRHNVGGAKSDRGDAKMLADLVRTDRHNHRQVAGDSELAHATRVLARAHQSLIWDRTRHVNRLRHGLRDYFPAAAQAFEGELAGMDAVGILAKAPTPAQAARLSVAQIRSALKAGGRQRNVEIKAVEIQQLLRADHLQASPVVEDAYGATTKSLIAIIVELNRQIESLETELATVFSGHPDTDIYRSLPGFGPILSARVLGEFGDDPERYANPKARKNYAGTSPLTRASGRSHIVSARYVRNRRLYDALDQAALCSINQSLGCRQFYDQRRAAGDLHHQALRVLANRLVGILHGCLKTRTHYNEHTAWAHRQPPQIKIAA